MSVAWTHTMAYDDVRAMLAVARDGTSLKAWRAEAARSTRLLAGKQCTAQLHIASAILRPVEKRIVDDGFLSDLGSSDARAAHDVIYARYLAVVPLARILARALWGGARVQGAIISRERLVAALTSALPSVSQATHKRSCTAFLTEFARAGVVRPLREGGFELADADPAPIAVLHLLIDDLRERREASDAWVTTSSLPALLFALSVDRMRRFLDRLIEEGRIRRSYYAGEPRVVAA